MSPYIYMGIIVFGIPQYFLLTAFLSIGVIIGVEMLETIPLASFAATLIVAVCGTIYVARKAPSAEHQNKGLVILTGISVVLITAICLTYSHFRTEILYDFGLFDYGNTKLIQDERGRERFSGDETDLSDYKPFSKNNKLIKIESPTLSIDAEHPRIHGALALYPVYAAAVEAAYHLNETNEIEDRYFIRGGTSPDAFDSLFERNYEGRRSDMVFMAKPSEKQLQEAETAGIKLAITPIGYEVFVFFVNKTNPVADLSLEQIRNIYSKKITRWNEVGGKNERIIPFQRPEGSGSQTMMLKVMGDVPLAKPQKEEFQNLMGGIVNRVADYRNYGNSIGFSFRYYVEGMFKHDGVKLLKVNGVAPTTKNIRNGSYPLVGEMVIVTIKNENPNPNVQKLIDWFLSSQGQDLIEKVGYVPMKTAFP
ncbi:hypothetical protein FACS189454_00860 [Planctomycetales bacterium]|nr:hypothetical protein FACS189454_00860 [Planctomycetales bacterium]